MEFRTKHVPPLAVPLLPTEVPGTPNLGMANRPANSLGGGILPKISDPFPPRLSLIGLDVVAHVIFHKGRYNG
jgi:hypothetical protein